MPYGEFGSSEECDKFIRKHQNEVITDIVSLTNNKWNLMGSFKKNRERISFFNKNTGVLEEMFKQLETDKKVGAELMRKRVKRKKAKNVAEAGPDPKMMSIYKDVVGQTGDAPEEKDDYFKISADCPENAVQVDVFSISDGGARIKHSEFFTETADPVPVE
jgi:hypothetical protein